MPDLRTRQRGILDIPAKDMCFGDLLNEGEMVIQMVWESHSPDHLQVTCADNGREWERAHMVDSETGNLRYPDAHYEYVPRIFEMDEMVRVIRR